MRFDLLDECSTLVPFGLGVSRNRTFRDPDVPAKASKAVKRGSHLELPRTLLGAIRRMMSSSHRSFGRRIHAGTKRAASL
jgi:hypothetical protein